MKAEFEKPEQIHIFVDSEVEQHYTLNAKYLRPVIKENIRSILKLNANPTEPYENRKIQAMMTATLKGLLTVSGDSILKGLHPGRTDYPRPGRKDNIIEWYLTFAVDKFLDFLLANRIVFSGEHSEQSIQLTKIYTEPSEYKASNPNG
jgi:hypothetical protein